MIYPFDTEALKQNPPNKINKKFMTEEKKELTKQEENWMLMTTLQIPWKDANLIEDRSDRDFLLDKVKEVQQFLQKQQDLEMQQQMAQQRMQQEPQGGGSPIITPQDILQGK